MVNGSKKRHDKDILAEEFETIIKKFGTGGHIIVPLDMVGKKVRVIIKVL